MFSSKFKIVVLLLRFFKPQGTIDNRVSSAHVDRNVPKMDQAEDIEGTSGIPSLIYVIGTFEGG